MKLLTHRMGTKQKVVSSVVSQFRCPRGAFGRLAGWVMALRPSNRSRNRSAVELLDVRPTDRVLEIGFGPGIAVRELAKRASRGHVVGVDHSELMVRHARRRNAKAVRQGIVELRRGSVEELPKFDVPFDRVLAVNTMGFWRDPDAVLARLRELMRRGGRIAIVSQPRCPGATAATTTLAAHNIVARLGRAGFVRVRVESLPLSPPVACVLGEVA